MLILIAKPIWSPIKNKFSTPRSEHTEKEGVLRVRTKDHEEEKAITLMTRKRSSSMASSSKKNKSWEVDIAGFMFGPRNVVF